MSKKWEAVQRAAGASSVLRKVFRALPCRVPAATWQSENLEWTAPWLRVGAENLNGRVSLLEAQAMPAVITLGPRCWLRFDVWPPESVSRFEGGLRDVASAWGLYGKLRDGILLYCGSHFPQHASTGKRVPEFTLEMGWSFRRPPASKKASGAAALEAFRLLANARVSCSWSGARRRGRSCIPRRWG